jgi:hypothetical protein
MTVNTGVVGQITVSGTVLSGTGASGMEASITIGKDREYFLPVGTDVKENVTGMRNVEGTVKRKWISGDTLFQSLLTNDTDFEVTIAISGAGTSITASGCRAGQIVRRVAPGTEVMVEEMTFVGRNWY